MSSSSQKMATQIPKPNCISARHIKGENIAETDTKPIKIENQIRRTLAALIDLTGTQPRPQFLKSLKHLINYSVRILNF